MMIIYLIFVNSSIFLIDLFLFLIDLSHLNIIQPF